MMVCKDVRIVINLFQVAEVSPYTKDAAFGKYNHFRNIPNFTSSVCFLMDHPFSIFTPISSSCLSPYLARKLILAKTTSSRKLTGSLTKDSFEVATVLSYFNTSS
jgi:hypothetical protein